MLTTRKAAPGLLLALVACCIAPGAMRAAETPVAGVAVSQSSPRTTGTTSKGPTVDVPVAAIPDPVSAGPSNAETPHPAEAPPVPILVPVSVAIPPAPAVTPVVPERVAEPAAAPAKPRARAPAAKAPSRPVVPSQRLSGRLDLAAGPKQPVAAGEVAQGVVYFLPKAGGGRPRPARFSVDTQSKGFSPSLLVVPLGSTVSFPNRDQILHNVFSKTPGATFDLGYYGPGTSRETRFTKPGLVVVNCSVHNAMRSNVLVLATPYYTRPGPDGRFSLAGLPPGPGTLVFWHPRANPQSLAFTGPVSGPLLRRMVATRAPLDGHRH